MRNRVFILISVLLLLLSLYACSNEAELPRWSFSIEGADSKVFSSFDYAKLDEATITVERMVKEGITEEFCGVALRDVLDYLGVSEYSSITLTSRGGSSVEYSPEVMESPDTLLVFEVNGRTQWENGVEIVQVVSGTQAEDQWLWNLKTLTVNP